MRWLKEPLPAFRRQRQGQRSIPGREAPLTAVLYLHDLPPLIRDCLRNVIPPGDPQAPHPVGTRIDGPWGSWYRSSQDLAVRAGLRPGQITRKNLGSAVIHIRRSWRAVLSWDLFLGPETGPGDHPSLVSVFLSAGSDLTALRHLIASFQALGIRVVFAEDICKTYGSMSAFVQNLEALERGIPGGSP